MDKPLKPFGRTCYGEDNAYEEGFSDALDYAEAEAERQFHVDEASLNRFKFIINKVRNNYK